MDSLDPTTEQIRAIIAEFHERKSKVSMTDWVKVVGTALAVVAAIWAVSLGLLKSEFVSADAYAQHEEKRVAHEKEAAAFAGGVVSTLESIDANIKGLREELRERKR